MKPLLLALSFLTIIPSWGNKRATEEEMTASLYFFPAVGLLIGACLVGIAYWVDILGLNLAGDALIIVAGIVLTGGFHWDGLMDTADGIFSGRSRERKLEIMKDSRIGAMGVLSLVTVILVKLAFLNHLSLSVKLWLLFLMPAVGRTLILLAISFFPYARNTPGLGTVFGPRPGKTPFWFALLVLMAISYYFGNWWGLCYLLVTVLAAAIFCVWVSNILNGQTGDTYGAVCEITETLYLVAAVMIMQIYSAYL